MKVLIDGKEVKCNGDVKVIYPQQFIDADRSGKFIYGDLVVTLNNEGFIADTFPNGDNPDPHKSMWKTLEDIIEETH